VRPHVFALMLPLLPLFCSVEPSKTRAGETRPFDVHMLVSLERASEPAVSPSGHMIAFTLRTTDLEANKGRKDIWVVRSNGSGLRRLTTHPASDRSPQWVGDRSIAFLSDREGSTQIYTIDIDGGEAIRATDLPVDVDNLRVSADGRLVAFSAEVYPDCPDLACTAKRDKEQAGKKATGRIYNSLFARRWDSWSTGKRNHLFMTALRGGAPPVDLARGLPADSPTRPFGGIEEFSLSPDGKWMAMTFKAPMGSQEAWSTNDDVWLAPTDGSSLPKNLTQDNPARDEQPVFSPDGKAIAYLAMKRPGYEADRRRVVLYDIAQGTKKWLTEDWDRTADSVAYSRSGDRLYVTAYETGQHSVFSVDPKTGRTQIVAREGHNEMPMDTDQGVVFLRDALNSPADFWSASANGGNEKRLTQLNAERLGQTRMGTAEQYSFKGAKGDTVYAYLVRPVDFDPGRKYPLAFLVHGGPQGSMANDFHYRWNPQTYAGAGYAAVMIDFHGSTGYGQAFQDAINHDWGGAPFEDLMLGLDATLVRYPWIDGSSVCALGASYGGYMINYLAGKTDRFKCLVAHDGNLDERMAYFDTEELWFPEWEHGGTPWDNPEGYSKHNPIELVKNWKTPTLVVHGGLDYRVVDTQGLSVFTALQRKGIASRLLYFPDENHWVLKPANSILWHETVLGWLDEWLKPKPKGG
jgi:dipeptidyl aminopeptidase/acylaminoacyl peptidase